MRFINDEIGNPNDHGCDNGDLKPVHDRGILLSDIKAEAIRDAAFKRKQQNREKDRQNEIRDPHLG